MVNWNDIDVSTKLHILLDPERSSPVVYPQSSFSPLKCGNCLW